MSFIVAVADTIENELFIKRFEARSIKECQDKVMEYITDNFDWADDVELPDDYHSFVNYVKECNILISDIKDIELI